MSVLAIEADSAIVASTWLKQVESTKEARQSELMCPFLRAVNTISRETCSWILCSLFSETVSYGQSQQDNIIYVPG